MSKTEVVHFVVSGEFLTKQARSFWDEENEPQRALGILKGVQKLSAAQALDILEGRSRLTGESSKGIRLEADKAKMPALLDIIVRLQKERDTAREDAADLLQIVNGDTVGIASPTGKRMVPIRQTEMRKGRRCLKEGLGWDDAYQDPKKKTVEPRFWQSTDYGVETTSRSRDVEDDEDEEEERIEPLPLAAPLEPKDKITSDIGWLSPEGKFYECRYAQHNWTASRLKLDPYEMMDKLGWVKAAGKDVGFFHGDYKTITAIQKEMILAYCSENGLEKPWWAED